MKPALAAALIFSAQASGQPLDEADTAALLSRLAGSRSGHAVQAEFVEKRMLPMCDEPVVETGTIAFEPPGRFLRKTKNLTVCDGKFLWMYYPEFRQAEKYPLSARGPGQLFTALGQALQFQKIAENFKVAATGLDDGFRLELSPRSGPLRRMLQSIMLDLDKSLRLRSSVMLGKDGDRVETTYSNEKILPLGSIDFSFTPPASATVVSPLGG
ncbi:MAG: outer membrane lipoprotein carrier protein LolA [Terrimicrobiaceae bacterium]